MNAVQLRRRLPTLAALAVAGILIGLLVSHSHSTVTRARLERTLPPTFARLYVQQARILGHKGVTVQSLHARAECDKGGPNVADQGPGNNWICLMKWHDPNIDETLLPGKFELNVHGNDCFTAGGPSKIVGLAAITDTRGKDVMNPVFEFDGCFDSRASNKPTGVIFPTTTTSTSSTPTPAALSLPHQADRSVRTGRIRLVLTCSAGDGGCAGTIAAQDHLGRETYVLAPGKTAAITFVLGARTPPASLRVTVTPVIGTGPAATVSLPVRPTA